MKQEVTITKKFLLQEVFKLRKTQKQIALELGCGIWRIENAMSKFQLTNQLHSRYKVKEEKMNPADPYFMYAVGLFITDGSIAKDGRLSIRINDREPIKVLGDYFDCPIYHCRRDTTRPQFEFNIPYSTPLTEYCKKLSSELSTKTFNVRVPLDIEDEKLNLLLLRGIIDGDGSIRPDSTSIRIFTASKLMSSSLSSLLKKLDIEHTIQNTVYGRYKKTGWTITTSVKATVPALIRIYEDFPELSVKRKREIVRNKVYDIVRTYKMINCKKWK